MLLTNPNNFVPIARTPWGGSKIAAIKKEQLKGAFGSVPDKIGESWEVSTEPSFPSLVVNHQNETLENTIRRLGCKETLGHKMFEEFGNHCPLLLKWLHADSTLSVQLHPNHNNIKLKSNECGKPESWLVLDTDPGGFVYLGFKKGVSVDEAFHEMKFGDPDRVLHKIFPSKGDLISVPTGLVHATGKGVLIAEPQFVLPKKIGKTWRMSDWGRRYDSQGNIDQENGKNRELHLEEAWDAVDWSLPRGTELNETLVISMKNEEKFEGNKYNPFACMLIEKPGFIQFDPFFKDTFSLFSCLYGRAKLRSNGMEEEIVGGQSGLFAASEGQIQIELQSDILGKCQMSFFSLNLMHI